MNKAILIIDMPSCCDECFALDDNGDYPVCLITQEQRGYTFKTREQKMDKCPICEYESCQCIYAGNAHPDRYKRRQVVLDHLYLLSDEEIRHIQWLQAYWQTSYEDPEKEAIREKFIKERTND